MVLILLVAGWLAGAGCVSKKYAAASAIGAQPTPIDANLGGEPLAVRLNSVIIYHGPGTWKQEAYWDELIVTVSNVSDRPATFGAARLVDHLGSPQTAGDNPWQTEKLSLSQKKRYEKAGVNFALNALGYAAFTYGAVGAGVIVGAVTTSTWSGLAAGATVGLVAVPVTAIVIYARNQNKRGVIENEFHRRRLKLPLTLQPGESQSGSLFFPMTVSPKELVVEWLQDGKAGVTRLVPAALAGLHDGSSARPTPR